MAGREHRRRPTAALRRVQRLVRRPTRPAAAVAAPRPTLDPAVFDKNFPALDAKANGQIKMLWITCGTADSLLGVNRQFKDVAEERRTWQFTEEEVEGMGHVWPLWRQNLTDFVQKAFQPATK